MNPTHLHLRNYRTFVHLDLPLPAGAVGVLGVNGAGKSTIVGAIEVALFGPPDSRTLAPYLAEQATTETVLVNLEFEHSGETYSVGRSYNAAGRGKTMLDLARLGPDWHAEPDEHGDPVQVQSHPDWETLTQETAAATQARLEQIIGLSRDTFRASAFLAQGDGAAFTEAEPRQRKRILAEVLGLDVWERARAAVADDRRAAEASQAGARAKVETLEQRTAGRVELEAAIGASAGLISSAEAAIILLELELVDRGTAVADARVAVERAAALQAAARAAHADATRHDGLATQAETARRDLTVLQDELGSLTTREQLDAREGELASVRSDAAAFALQVADHERQVQARAHVQSQRDELVRRSDAIAAERSALVDEVADLRQHDPLTAAGCPHCKQTMGEQAREAYIETAVAAAAAKGREETKLLQQIDQLELPRVGPAPTPEYDYAAGEPEAASAVASARADVEQRARLEERRTVLEQTIAGVTGAEYTDENLRLHEQADAAQKALDALPVPGNLDELEGLRRGTERALAEARDELAVTRADTDQAQGRLAEMNAAEADAEEQRRILRTETVAAAALSTLEQAFGRDGVPAWLVEQHAIPQIEAEASRILAELGGPVSRVELRTERLLKSGGTADELDIVCVTEAGERDYSTFSGGEKTRVNVALRIALARLLAHRKGAESRVLCIDEPEFLDDEGTARLVGVLQGEVAADFDRVMLVSHVPALRDAFENVLAVSNIDGRSEVAAT